MTDIFELSWRLQDGKDHFRKTINLPVKDALLSYVKEKFGDFYCSKNYLKSHLWKGDLNDWHFSYNDCHERKIITAIDSGTNKMTSYLAKE